MESRIIKGDCLEELKKLDDESVDLIFADPPYNMQLEQELYRPNHTKVEGVDDEWDKFASFAHYDDFCRAWLSECRRVLKSNGTIWVIGSYHNIFRVGNLMLDLGFWILNDVTWAKTNPMPNFLGRRFTNATETLLWCSKDKNVKKYTFNHKLMKRYNGGKQMTSVWSIALCTGGERLKGEDGKKAHSTQKPEELLKRVILSSTKLGDVVLDPFFGTGTTGAVAKKLKRHFIGIEQDEGYIRLAEKRIAHIKENFEEADWVEEKSTAVLQKVAFTTLIEKGYFKQGESFYSKKRYNTKVTVLHNGHLQYNNEEASIHKMGAKVGNTPTCNGWTFWYAERSGKAIVLDDIRKQYWDDMNNGLFSV